LRLRFEHRNKIISTTSFFLRKMQHWAACHSLNTHCIRVRARAPTSTLSHQHTRASGPARPRACFKSQEQNNITFHIEILVRWSARSAKRF
jgi:hypothetical protein